MKAQKSNSTITLTPEHARTLLATCLYIGGIDRIGQPGTYGFKGHNSIDDFDHMDLAQGIRDYAKAATTDTFKSHVSREKIIAALSDAGINLDDWFELKIGRFGMAHYIPAKAS